ncbi:sigma-70 family RNA polymerase sigma factor [Nonomuraea cavernae]|uniref:RNA polymerase principal sigma factor HrdC n=1 Tax=Nonomuraea cavernae TaxID=2045107 RepID=A0A917ZID3_9ACTN|nr:sigma-70 family RNA polymerase sigma factor [Nonomuraea cavernae]MCA2189695.1 sigma-70 family RNA polymerase sigma factor [Nonomuraea cavernae]GGO83077.1 RNA polymerase principal sigma factor HrdC [Nonomuraea cavernae]
MSAHVTAEAEPDHHDQVGDYLARIRTTPLLTAEQEVRLAKRIEAGVYAARLIEQGSAKAGLDAAVADGRAAREQLILANLRLVVSIAKRYAHRGMPLADVIQDGNLGLIRAVERFDHAKGYRFSTCATWWIRKAIQQGLEYAYPVRLPAGVRDRLSKIARAESVVTHRLGRSPTERELAEEVGHDLMKYVPLRQLTQAGASLDASVGEGRHRTTLGELVTDDQSPTAEWLVDQQDLKVLLDSLVDALPPSQARVVRLRFGLDGCGQHKPEQIAERMGLTPYWVRRMERESLTRLRRYGARRGLRAWTR